MCEFIFITILKRNKGEREKIRVEEQETKAKEERMWEKERRNVRMRKVVVKGDRVRNYNRDLHIKHIEMKLKKFAFLQNTLTYKLQKKRKTNCFGS